MAQPDLIPMPFAENATPGTIEPIPATTPTVPQDATWSTGFPQVTMQPLASGGIPPRGQNFNGVLNALSQHIFHMQGGGQYKWDDAHGPYSIGDVLQSDDGLRSYVSAIGNNTDNFNTTPGVIGSSWLPWSGGTATELIAGLLKIATTAQAQSMSSDDVAITPKKMADALSVSALGNNQSWQDVLSDRTISTNYTNTTGRPIAVSVATNNAAANGMVIQVDGIVVSMSSVTSGPDGSVFAIVPNGSVYRVTGSVTPLAYWAELR